MNRRLFTALALCWVGVAPIASAQQRDITTEQSAAPNLTATESAPAETERNENLSGRIAGLFDIDLPRFDPPGTFRVQLNPRFGDLFRRDYMRVPVGVRWTANDRFELNAEAEAYFTHDSGSDDAGNGIGELRFGARYLIPKWPRAENETSIGLNVEIPVGTPPIDMTDGRNHFSPYFVVQHRSPLRPRWTTFAGMSADIITSSSVIGQRIENTPSDDAISITGGAIYDLGQVKWTVQATYTTSAISGHDEHIFSVRPSVLWFLPREYTFNSKTQWIVGFGVRGTWGPDGFDASTGTRVRAEITFRQAIRHLRDKINGD